MTNTMQFSRHETFFFREGWLTKGMRFVAGDNPRVFQEKNAMEQLGIGNNMVKSLRYWMQATGLTIETGKKAQELTSFGQLVFKYDPYLEDELTLWLLHYHLITNKAMATTWYWFFNEFLFKDFDEGMLLQNLSHWAHEEGAEMSDASLKRDVDCLISTYLPRKNEQAVDPENNICCPLTELGLMEAIPDGRRRRIRLTQVDVKKIPLEAFLYVLFDQLGEREQGELCYLDIEQLLSGCGQLGKVFLLGLGELIAVLEKLQEAGWLHVLKTAGLNQISLRYTEDWETIAARYYTERFGRQG